MTYIGVGFNRVWATLLVAGLLVAFLPSPKAHAGLEECLVSVSPTYSDAGVDTFFNFNVTNNSSNPIRWLKITSPDVGLFTVQGGSSTGWSAYSDSDNVTFRFGNLPAPYDQGFDILSSVNHASDGADWIVQASDSSSGTDPINCSGNTTVVTGDATIAISDINVLSVTTSSANIIWNTNVPGTTQVYYGKTSGYGQNTPIDSNMDTSHSATLSGLSPNTTYHYSVFSTDSNGNTVDSSDGTFITQALPSSSSSQSAISLSSSSSKSQSIPLLARPIEKTPPTVSITTDLSRVVATAPRISGTADDNTALARLEYSTDGGKNWLPVDASTGLGSKRAAFSFTPLNLEEDNYSILVRATDTSGNIGLSTPTKLVIDRLPPVIGGNVLSLGPQILEPNRQGVIASLVGVDQRMTLSAVGGSTSIVIHAVSRDAGNKAKDQQMFNLTKSTDTGLWSGALSFAKSGVYGLVAESVDGAGNKTVKTLNSVNVAPPARVVDSTTGKPIVGKLTVYYQDPYSNNWVVWDAASYGQKNPQTTSKSGEYTLLLPPGKYYFKTTASGHETLISSIFETDVPMPFSGTIKLTSLKSLSLGSFQISAPSLSVKKVNVSPPKVSKHDSGSGQGTIEGKQAPDFSLSSTGGGKVHMINLLGKPTLLVFGSTWSPSTNQQLSVYADLQRNQDVNVYPVAVQQSVAKVRAYTDIANLNLQWLVDLDGVLSNSYGAQTLPTNYFINRQGVIKQVVVGPLSKQQIINILGSL